MRRHEIPSPPPPDRVELGANLFRALADPTRLLLLVGLLETERTVGELVALVQKPQSTVSRHLGVLRQADLVRTRRDAQHVVYRLASVHVADLVVQAMSHAEHVVADIPHEHGDSAS